MMFRISLLALSALSLAGVVSSTQESFMPNDGSIHISESWDYSVCGYETDVIQIKSIVVTPDPPKPGQDMTVQLTGEVLEVIEEGAYADVTVKMGLVKLLHKQFDLCEEARNANTTVQCPIDKGEYQIEQTVALPREIPPGKFVVNVRGYTTNDDDMVCVDLNVDFRKGHLLDFHLGW